MTHPDRPMLLLLAGKLSIAEMEDDSMIDSVDRVIYQLREYMKETDGNDNIHPSRDVIIISGSRETILKVVEGIYDNIYSHRLQFIYHAAAMYFEIDGRRIYLRHVSCLKDCGAIFGRRCKIIFVDVADMPIGAFERLFPVDIHHGGLSGSIATDLANLFAKYMIDI